MLMHILVHELVVEALVRGLFSMEWLRQGASRVEVVGGCTTSWRCAAMGSASRDKVAKDVLPAPTPEVGRHFFPSASIWVADLAVRSLQKGALWPARREQVQRGGDGWHAP